MTSSLCCARRDRAFLPKDELWAVALEDGCRPSGFSLSRTQNGIIIIIEILSPAPDPCQFSLAFDPRGLKAIREGLDLFGLAAATSSRRQAE
jgi:hypothetical protein